MMDIFDKFEEYEEIFKESFPTFMFMSRSDQEIIEIIDRCINENKNVYDLGLIVDDEDVKY